jgi:hypothetical protein
MPKEPQNLDILQKQLHSSHNYWVDYIYLYGKNLLNFNRKKSIKLLKHVDSERRQVHAAERRE